MISLCSEIWLKLWFDDVRSFPDFLISRIVVPSVRWNLFLSDSNELNVVDTVISWIDYDFSPAGNFEWILNFMILGIFTAISIAGIVVVATISISFPKNLDSNWTECCHSGDSFFTTIPAIFDWILDFRDFQYFLGFFWSLE